MRHIRFALLALLALPAILLSQGAVGQDNPEWILEAENMTLPLAEFGRFEDQESAVAAIAEVPGPQPYAGDAYSFVKEVKSVVPTLDGKTKITYWLGKSKPLDPDWSYVPGGANEPEALLQLREIFTTSMCTEEGHPPAVVTPTGEWQPLFPDGEDIAEVKDVDVTFYDYDPETDTCIIFQLAAQISRSRNMMCPTPHTMWDKDEQACVNNDLVAHITGPASQCETGVGPAALVGNPCDAKTGNKTQTETDIDLGWIDFSRTYNSQASLRTGGFGGGWSHNHEISLAFGPGVLQVITGSGHVRQFSPDASQFAALDGSGDRIVPYQSGWQLLARDRTLTFDSSGKLTGTITEAGRAWGYVYDAIGRLVAIGDANGRVLEIQYQGPESNSPIQSLDVNGATYASYGYAPNGLVSSVEFQDGSEKEYHYEDSAHPKKLTGVTGEDGVRFSTFAYDAKGRVTSSTHPNGVNQISLVYSANSTNVTDALGQTATYSFTPESYGRRRLSTVSTSLGTTSFGYKASSLDPRAPLVSETDKRGTVTRFDHSVVQFGGRTVDVIETTQAHGTPLAVSTTTKIDRLTNKVTEVQRASLKSEFIRNGRGQVTLQRLTDLQNNDAREFQYSYCEAQDVSTTNSTCPVLGYLKSADGPRSDVQDVVTYQYYPEDSPDCAIGPTCSYRKGDLWKVSNPLGHVTEILLYDNAGRILSSIDANGVVTDRQYTEKGLLSSLAVRGLNDSSIADDRITSLEYEPFGLVRKQTNPDGSWVSYVYDDAHRLTETVDSAGNKVVDTLDAGGNVIERSTYNAAGVKRRHSGAEFDQAGRMVESIDSREIATVYAYDAESNIVSVTDGAGSVVTATYDALGRIHLMSQMQGSSLAETETLYGPGGELASVTDPKGLVTSYQHDAFGQRRQTSSPDSGVTAYSYDAQGNLVSVVDARGVTRSSSYDALGRRTQEFSGSAVLKSATYDVASTSCPTGEQFSVGRLSEETADGVVTTYCYNRFGDLVRKRQVIDAVVLEVSYLYDPSGRLVSTRYPDNSLVSYARDSHGDLTGMSVTPSGASTSQLISNVAREPFGPVSGWTYGNGRQLQRTYDADYRALSILDSAVGGLDLSLAYDDAGKVSQIGHASTSLPVASLTYDPAGRLTEFRDAATSAPIDTYSYDTTGNRTLSSDSNGSVASTFEAGTHRLNGLGGTARSYDQAGNMLTVGSQRQFTYNQSGRMSKVSAGATTLREYQYNAKGQQVVKKSGATRIYSIYDEQGNWLGDYDEMGVPRNQAIWFNNQPIGLLAGSSAAAERLKYVQVDHLGAPRAVIDPVRNVAIWEWDASGEPFGNSPPNEDPDGDGTAFSFDLRFPGQRHDSVSGLNYNYFRDYDPASGRYVQSDPIGLAGGISTYAYGGSDPISRVDRLGLAFEPAGDEVPGYLERLRVGFEVHTAFSEFVTAMGYQANNTHGGTFGNLRPDVFDPGNKFIWELKPYSNLVRDDLYFGVATNQMNSYIVRANRPRTEDPRTKNCMGWKRGDTAELFRDGQVLGTVQIAAGPISKTYEITLYHDRRGSHTGLVFYRADQVSNTARELREDLLRELSKPRVWWLPPINPNNDTRPAYP